VLDQRVEPALAKARILIEFAAGIQQTQPMGLVVEQVHVHITGRERRAVQLPPVVFQGHQQLRRPGRHRITPFTPTP